MKNMSFIKSSFLVFVCLTIYSCQDLTLLNENPNGINPETANPNLVLSTVLTETGKGGCHATYSKRWLVRRSQCL